MRASSNQRIENALKHSFGLSKHIVIPESDHAKSKAREISRALKIERQTVRVLSTVNLYDQASADTNEIHDIWANRLLSAEAIVAEMAIAQVTPQTTLGIGRICV